jgi:hypothetical protein
LSLKVGFHFLTLSRIALLLSKPERHFLARREARK